MRVLAVDPGGVRVGLALSDESRTLATPHSTLNAGPRLAQRISAIADAAGASVVVVGLPRRLDGSDGPEAVAARRLAEEIAGTSGLLVELWDERFTSVIAESALVAARPKGGRRRASARREATHSVAAAVLLQSYLDRGAAPDK